MFYNAQKLQKSHSPEEEEVTTVIVNVRKHWQNTNIHIICLL